MTLDPVDYWRLRALDGDVQRNQLAVALAQTNLETAQKKRQTVWVELVAKYELDPAKNYTATDDGCVLAEAT